MLKGILFGLCSSLISIIVYWFWVRRIYPGQTVISFEWLVQRPAFFAYGVAVGIGLVSTLALVALRLLRMLGESTLKS
jgi:hypothetical protein